MNAYFALPALDWWRLRNSIASIARSPGRAFGWLAYLAVIAFYVSSRLHRSHHALLIPRTHQASTIIAAFALFLATGSVAAVGSATRGLQPIDVMMLVRSRIPPGFALLWIGLRSFVFARLLQICFLCAVAISLLRYPAASAAIGIFSWLIMLAFLPYPFLILRRFAPRITTIVTTALALGATAILFIGALAPRADPGFGWFAHNMLAARPFAISIVLCIAAACLLSALLTRDVYPELYGAAQLSQTVRERSLRGAFGFPRLAATKTPELSRSNDHFALYGAWALLQRTYIESFRNSRRIAVFAALALAIGAAVGVAPHFAPQRDIPTFAITMSLVGYFSYSLLRVASFADELRRPMWWNVAAPVPLRLAVAALAQTMQLTFYAAAFSVGLALTSLDARFLLLPFGVLAFGFVMRAVSFLSYAVSPSALDQRGPAVIVRVLLMYAFGALAAAGAVLAYVVTRSFLGALTGAIVVIAASCVAAIYLTAWRVERMGAQLALVEAL